MSFSRIRDKTISWFSYKIKCQTILYQHCPFDNFPRQFFTHFLSLGKLLKKKCVANKRLYLFNFNAIFSILPLTTKGNQTLAYARARAWRCIHIHKRSFSFPNSFYFPPFNISFKTSFPFITPSLRILFVFDRYVDSLSVT